VVYACADNSEADRGRGPVVALYQWYKAALNAAVVLPIYIPCLAIGCQQLDLVYCTVRSLEPREWQNLLIVVTVYIPSIDNCRF